MKTIRFEGHNANDVFASRMGHSPKKGICSKCFCSSEAIRHFRWTCKEVVEENLDEHRERQRQADMAYEAAIEDEREAVEAGAEPDYMPDDSEDPMLFDAIGHVGVGAERQKWNVKEKLFARFWQKENSDDKQLLSVLLSRNNQPWTITQRDAIVAATVMQWLGTNCGQGYLWSVEQAIKNLEKREDHTSESWDEI